MEPGALFRGPKLLSTDLHPKKGEDVEEDESDAAEVQAHRRGLSDHEKEDLQAAHVVCKLGDPQKPEEAGG